MADRHAESYQDPGKFGGVDWPSQDAEAVTPSNTVDLVNVSRALYIGGAGTVVVNMAKSGTIISFVGVPAGTVLPIRVSRVRATGTTATNIVSLD